MLLVLQCARRESQTSLGVGWMRKILHEIRDPIHTFVRLDTQERELLDARPLQRLRRIRQLGMSHYIYPGANHNRFEHSLGAMDLAGRVYDTLVDPENVTDEVRELLPRLGNSEREQHWRRILRAAALCHDVGHLPFSHASEDLLPDGMRHEHLTKKIILGELAGLFQGMEPALPPNDVAFVALGPEFFDEKEPDPWAVLVSEIITNDAFGVDRMDYLLRDSYHVGVPNGRFDYERLIDTMRILRPPPQPDEEGSEEPTIGVEEGGLHSAEALIIARFFMYAQVYYHRGRRIYDIHLKDFLKEWLADGRYSPDDSGQVDLTDDEVYSALWENAGTENGELTEYAKRIIERQHFKFVFRPDPARGKLAPIDRQRVYEALADEYDEENVRQAHVPPKEQVLDFPVQCEPSNEVASARGLSQLIETLPALSVDFVYVAPGQSDEAKKWLERSLDEILSDGQEGQ